LLLVSPEQPIAVLLGLFANQVVGAALVVLQLPFADAPPGFRTVKNDVEKLAAEDDHARDFLNPLLHLDFCRFRHGLTPPPNIVRANRAARGHTLGRNSLY